ncbi:hypothetical protein VPH35_100654 [Triticum aestivum]
MAKKRSATVASLLLCVALAGHAVTAARTVHAAAGGAAETSLPAAIAAENGSGAGGEGAADEKNLFVGVGGMGDLPSMPALGDGYGGGFGNNGDDLLTGVTGPLGGGGGGPVVSRLEGSPVAAPCSAGSEAGKAAEAPVASRLEYAAVVELARALWTMHICT